MWINQKKYAPIPREGIGEESIRAFFQPINSLRRLYLYFVKYTSFFLKT